MKHTILGKSGLEVSRIASEFVPGVQRPLGPGPAPSAQHVGGLARGRGLRVRVRRTVGKSQPTISHHMKILSEAGLVHGDRRGKWVWYSLNRDRLAQVRAALDG